MVLGNPFMKTVETIISIVTYVIYAVSKPILNAKRTAAGDTRIVKHHRFVGALPKLSVTDKASTNIVSTHAYVNNGSPNNGNTLL